MSRQGQPPSSIGEFRQSDSQVVCASPGHVAAELLDRLQQMGGPTAC